MKPANFWKDKIRWQAQGEGPAAPIPDVIPDPAPAAEAVDTSFIPEAFVKDGKPDLEAFKAHYADLTKAPDVPDAYDFTLPADLKFDGLPEGMVIDIDTKDAAMAPLFESLTSVLKEMKAPAGAAQKVSGLLAQYEAVKFSQALKAQEAELASLGPQGVARIEAVTRAMQAALPADLATALQGVTKSAKALQAIETLLGPRGLASPSPLPTGGQQDALAARYPNTATR